MIEACNVAHPGPEVARFCRNAPQSLGILLIKEHKAALDGSDRLPVRATSAKFAKKCSRGHLLLAQFLFNCHNDKYNFVAKSRFHSIRQRLTESHSVCTFVYS